MFACPGQITWHISSCRGDKDMHPNFWLIIICAVIAITIAIVMNKKKK
jgi:hypothetical protein